MTIQTPVIDADAIKARISAHCDAAGVDVPENIMTANGQVSKSLFEFAKKANLSLDWLISGTGPQQRHTPQLDQMPTSGSILAAVTEIEFARHKRDQARVARDKADSEGKPDFESFFDAHPSTNGVELAEQKLRALCPDNPIDALRKVSCLLRGELTAETLAILQEEMTEILAEIDPLVRLRDRREELKRCIDKRAHLPNSPAYVDVDDAYYQVCEEAINYVPRTAEGVAALADLCWKDFGPSSIAGTADWEREMENPNNKMLANLRHGAWLMAGKRME
ncbi:hypothetical protein [uncultured Roseobacter sp.]|uniref:hypothetical protein n=1 Tax=uncultured Roseobacter sp. TaxID=114847 RepID=UPI0026123644|nr:hypothetical protein [uncultured Roseobacter sp.]